MQSATDSEAGDRAKAAKVPEQPGRGLANVKGKVLHFLTGDDVDASVRKMATWLAPGGRLYLVADTPYGVWRGKIPEFEAGKASGVENRVMVGGEASDAVQLYTSSTGTWSAAGTQLDSGTTYNVYAHSSNSFDRLWIEQGMAVMKTTLDALAASK